MPISKPDMLHDRDREWAAASTFATSTDLGTRLALVYGRRRQGALSRSSCWPAPPAG